MRKRFLCRLPLVLCTILTFGWGSGAANAQTAHVEVLYSFTNGPVTPSDGLVQGLDGHFYGTTADGGSADGGMVFRVTTNGEFASLVSFVGDNGWRPNGLTMGSDGSFYDTTYGGDGTVFRVSTNGILTTLAWFNYDNGSGPVGRLALGNDGNFYGTTEYGNDDNGLVFQVTTNGELTPLALFAYDGTSGINPEAGLTLGCDGNFYGSTYSSYGSNSNNRGAVFQVTTNGLITCLAPFTSDIGEWRTKLTLGSDGNFYGTSSSFYTFEESDAFKVTTNGVLTKLVSFTGDNGARPSALTLGNDGRFYGTTSSGGSNDMGTVFQLTTNGTLTTLMSFTGSDGANPRGELTLGNDGHFYGITTAGGSAGFGNVFRLVIDSASPIPLDIQLIGDQVVLSWTNAAFGLQAASDVTGVYTNIVGATNPYTNLITDSQRFFRLISN